MGYQFAGFLARPAISRPSEIPSGFDWRLISSPFDGISVRIPSYFDQTPSSAEIRKLASQLTFDSVDWIFLVYGCWGGSIDFVFALGQRNGEFFGPVECSEMSKTREAYVRVMSRFGLAEDTAMDFELFRRGYWADE